MLAMTHLRTFRYLAPHAFHEPCFHLGCQALSLTSASQRPTTTPLLSLLLTDTSYYAAYTKCTICRTQLNNGDQRCAKANSERRVPRHVCATSNRKQDGMANTHSAQRNQQVSILLRLPPELRMRVYDYVMDTDAAADILHHELWEWNRLEFSHTSRQIFAETAARYFEKKLLPLSSRMVGSLNARESIHDFVSKIPFHQGTHIKEIVLHAREEYGCFPHSFCFGFSLGSRWSLLAGLSNLKVINLHMRSTMLPASYCGIEKQGDFEIRYIRTKLNPLLI
jgi:hypothetical protein